jgi:hypothetical protein
MSVVTQWLEGHVPGFAALSDYERDAIADFSILWSLFEGRQLGTQASPTALKRFAASKIASGFDLNAIADSHAYFSQRYLQRGNETLHFAHLHLNRTDQHNVLAVLRGEDADPTNVLSAVLLIVYRLRNNLFHGVKWAYDIAGQRDNFLHASQVLMAVFTP